jgi:hypothetical protein
VSRDEILSWLARPETVPGTGKFQGNISVGLELSFVSVKK